MAAVTVADDVALLKADDPRTPILPDLPRKYASRLERNLPRWLWVWAVGKSLLVLLFGFALTTLAFQANRSGSETTYARCMATNAWLVVVAWAIVVVVIGDAIARLLLELRVSLLGEQLVLKLVQMGLGLVMGASCGVFELDSASGYLPECHAISNGSALIGFLLAILLAAPTALEAALTTWVKPPDIGATRPAGSAPSSRSRCSSRSSS